MRKLLKILFFLLPVLVTAQTTNNCYDMRYDMSGMTDTSGTWLLNYKSCKLKNSLPLASQDNFKVQEAGFYSMLEFTKSVSGNPFADAFVELKNSVSKENEFYVVIGRQNDNEGLYTKFYIDLNLPEITTSGCPSDFNSKAKIFLTNKIEENYNANGRSFLYANFAIANGIDALADYIIAAKECCANGEKFDKCLNCSSPDNMKAFLTSSGFVSNKIQNIGKYPIGSIPNIAEVADYAKQLFTINDLNVVDIPNSYKETIDTFKAKGLSIQVIITKDEHLCTPFWDSLTTVAEGGGYDLVYWHHIHKGKSFGNDYLYTKTFLKGASSSRDASGRALVLPLIPILKGLGSAITDVLLQAAIIYVIDEDVKTYGDAFAKVNYFQSGWSGVAGAFGVNQNAVLVGSAIASATGTVVYNAYHVQGYNVDQGTRDFVCHFFLNLIAFKTVGLATGFAAVKITQIGAKGFKKLAATVFWNSGIKPLKQEIELLWKLSKDKIVTPSSRGSLLQDWMHTLVYKSKGYINTDQWAKNFPVIDLHNAAEKIGISLKSTEATSYGQLNGLIGNHVDDIIKVLNKKSIAWNSYTAAVQKIKLVIIVPKNNISTVQNEVQKIIQSKGLNNNSNFEFIVDSAENLLKL